MSFDDVYIPGAAWDGTSEDVPISDLSEAPLITRYLFNALLTDASEALQECQGPYSVTLSQIRRLRDAARNSERFDKALKPMWGSVQVGPWAAPRLRALRKLGATAEALEGAAPDERETRHRVVVEQVWPLRDEVRYWIDEGWDEHTKVDLDIEAARFIVTRLHDQFSDKSLARNFITQLEAALESVPRPGEESGDLASLLAELDALIGLAPVKEQVRGLVAFLQVQKLREAQGLQRAELTQHMVFQGNPGTGKTTVARLVAKLYNAMGILERDSLVETDRSGLVAEYVGQTAVKTNAIIDAALGGVLFIDEAYSLVRDGAGGYGLEAIDILLKRMEDDRNRLIVIVAGYPRLMQSFLDSNPGLRSRFTRTIDFPDYTTEELEEIFNGLCVEHQYRLDDVARPMLRVILDRFQRGEGFGNGRSARQLFEAMIASQAARLHGVEQPDRDALLTLTGGDLEEAYQRNRTTGP